MIKAITFDLDGMVFEPKGYFSNEIEKELSLPNDVVLEFFKNELGDCQRGKLDMKTVLEGKYFPLWGWTKSFEAFAYWWFSGEKLNDEVIKLVERLKAKGIKCVLLTNNEKYRLQWAIGQFRLDEIFDVIVLPYEVGAIKPEKEIFQAVLDKTGLKSGEVVACDNEAKKLTGGQELGMHVLVAESVEILEKGINKLCDAQN